MGHKVNPDIFRLGISRTWCYQLRTNKNFLRNLFIFKLLRNLFVNYNIPLFNFKRHRNRKINDKLVLRGEEQIFRSPFVSKNVLFSHVFFGVLKDEIYIESYFIDAGLKQQLRRPLNPPSLYYPKNKEYQPWQRGNYKKRYFRRLLFFKKKRYKNLVVRNRLRLVLSSRKFRKLSRKSKLYVIKSVRTLASDLFFFSKNFNWKYNKNLVRFFKKRIKKKTLKKFLNKKLKLKFKTIYKLLRNFYKSYKLYRQKYKSLFFVKRKYHKFLKRHVTFKYRPLRYLRSIKYYRLNETPRYKARLKDYFEQNLLRLAKFAKSYGGTTVKTFLKKKSLPKVPLRVFDNFNYHKSSSSKTYRNLRTLKYFLRSVKFFGFFGIRKRIFFCYNLIGLLFNFMSLVKRTIISKKFYVAIQTLAFYTYSLNFFNFLTMRRKFFSRFLVYKAVSKTLFRSVLELIECKKLTYSITSQNKYRFDSSLVLNYILIKLGQYFNINEIVNPLSFFIKNLTSIAGYKIFIRGRLTRKERAAVMIRSGKKMPLSTVTAKVDYSQGTKIMKFGMVGIKVYLLHKPSHIINLYRFSFRYAKIS